MASPPYRVKAIFDYSSPHDDDLGFKMGQIILVTDEEDADWFYGEFDEGAVKHQGLFPRNFVEKYEPTTPPRPQRPVRPKRDTESSSVGQHRLQEQSRPGGPDLAEGNASSTDPQPEPEASSVGVEHQNTPTAATESHEHQNPVTTLTGAAATEASQQLPVEKKTVPLVSSKGPASSLPAQTANVGSFKDRIAAFNKPAAPPVAPQKPGNLSQSASSGFVKKAYVAPPPSRNAYVPPPKDTAYTPHKRGSVADNTGHSQRIEGPPATVQDDNIPEPSEEQPKPTSLKDRIALLQKQQLEQAARHAESAQKKEKPPKPPKKSTSQQSGESQMIGTVQEDTFEDTPVDRNEDDPRRGTHPARRGSKMVEDIGDGNETTVPRELLSDTNDADQSAGGDTEDGGEVFGNQNRARSTNRQEEPVSAQTDVVVTSPELKQPETLAKENQEIDISDQDEDIDPEVRRRMEIRERMAKMSGGMGMAGMFGPAGGLPTNNPRKPKQTAFGSTERVASGHEREPISDDRQPVPIMALPGMSFPTRQKVQSPESEDELFHPEESNTNAPSSGGPQDEDGISEGEGSEEAVASTSQTQREFEEVPRPSSSK